MLLGVVLLLTQGLIAQGFEVSAVRETYKGYIGEVLKAPIHFKNVTEKPITIVIRKVGSQLGSMQKSFYCINENCLNEYTEEYLLKLEPGQEVNNLSIGLETGLISGASSAKYIAYSRSSPLDIININFNFEVEEKPQKSNIYSSPYITIYDVFPNPVVDFAQFQYQILNERINAAIVIHNILGNPIGEFELDRNETKLKIRTEDYSAGIYFYTLYIDNEGIMTRKLIVKK
jgi:hypothetical protein